ncbi:hypothetical protein Tco_1013498, partial [Tanacetum coccineum]
VNKVRIGAKDFNWGSLFGEAVTSSDIQHSAATQIWGCYRLVSESRSSGRRVKISDGGSPRVIVYGYDGLLIQPVASPSPDYIPGPNDPQTSPVRRTEVYMERVSLCSYWLMFMIVDRLDTPEDIPLEFELCSLSEEEEEEEKEEHFAPADSTIAIPTDEPVSPPEGTEPVIPPPSTDITIGARIIVRPQASISLLPGCTDPPAHSSPPPVPLPLLPSPGCPTQIQTLWIASTQALIDAVTAALPSPSLPPLPQSLYIPPPVDLMDDLPESELPPRKRLCLSTLSSRYEIGESSTARPTKGQGVDYGFISTIDAEARRQGISEVGYGIRDTWVDLVEAVLSRHTMTVEESTRRYGLWRRRAFVPEWLGLNQLIESVRDPTQAKLLAPAECLQRRDRQRTDARIPDHRMLLGEASDIAPPSPDYIPGPEDPHTPPVPQDEDNREPMFIQLPDPDYVPEPMYPEYIPLKDEHVFPAEEQPLTHVDSPTVESPGYVTESDPEEDPEEYDNDETEDGPADYPMDGGDNGDDDDGDSSRADADDEDEDKEEEHPALTDSVVVIPPVEPVSPPEGTKPVIPPSSTDISTIGTRITVRLQASISLPPEAEVERLLDMTTPSPSPPSAGERLARCTAPPAHSSPPPVPSPLLPSSGCPTQIQTLRIASTQALVDAVTTALPSPLLLPLPPSLYIPPPVNCRDGVPESKQPPRKRLCLSTLGSRYEVRESSTARPTGGRGVDYGFVSTADAEARRQGIRDVGVVELAELHEHEHRLYAPTKDASGYRSRISQRVDMDSQRSTYLGARMTLQEQYGCTRDPQPGTSDAATAAGYSHSETAPGHVNENFSNGDGSHSSHEDNRRNVQTARPCFYADFMKYQPLNFKWTEGVVGMTRWIEKIELVFNISGCAIENQVKFATCTLLGAALTG